MNAAASRDCLPNLLIVGVSRAGTTSLFNYLSRHPEICPSATKETHYFTPLRLGNPPRTTVEQYAANFAHCKGEAYRLEATPNYFYGGLPVIRAINSTLSEPRAIVILRNPVDRVWSNYQFKVSRGRSSEDGSFETFVSRCEQVLRGPAEDAANAGSYRALVTGFYVDFIRDWFAEMGPRFTVVFFDDLKRDSREVTIGLLEWLELDPTRLPPTGFEARNATVQPRNALLHRLGLGVAGAVGGHGDRGPVGRLLLTTYKALNSRAAGASMDPAMRNRLDRIFQEPNRQLGRELAARGYTLPEWAAPG